MGIMRVGNERIRDAERERESGSFGEEEGVIFYGGMFICPPSR